MPLSSLRRRTVKEPLPPQEEHKTPSPFRARSTTVPGLTPRKSLQSLLGSVRKRGGTVAGHPKANRPLLIEQDVLEQDLYETDDPSRATRKLYRTPSPHPAKDAARASLARPSHPDSPRTFLETLADAIRAPAALFYKGKRQNSEDDAPLVDHHTDSQAHSPAMKSAPSPAKTLGSKKSVRFKPGKSIINDELRSSPIDIPNAMPALPPMQLATTPLLQCFGKDHPDLIPTGRPRATPVLDSTVTFRQAMADAQEFIKDADIPDISPLGTPISDLRPFFSVTNAPVENPFNDIEGDYHATVEPSVPRSHGQDVASEKSERVASTTTHDEMHVNYENTQDLQETASVDIRLASVSPLSLSERSKDDTSLQPPSGTARSSLSELLPRLGRTASGTSLGINTTKTSLDQYDPDLVDSTDRLACPRHSIRRSRQIDERWTGRSTHEDIRQRFRQVESRNISDSGEADPFTDENCASHDIVCARATITPIPDFLAEMSPIQLPGSAIDKQLPTDPKYRRKLLLSSSDDDPYSPVLALQSSPWSAELAVGRKLSSLEKPVMRFAPLRPSGKFSAYTDISESDVEGGAILPPGYAETMQELTGDLLWSTNSIPAPFPGRSVSREMRSLSPAFIPLPLSPIRSMKHSYDLCTDEFGLYPFADEGDDAGNRFELPPGYDVYSSAARYPSEGYAEDVGHCPFGDEVGFHPEYAHSSALEPSFEDNNEESRDFTTELEEHLDATGQYFKIPYLTPEEHLAEAAEVLKRFTPRKSSDSSSCQLPVTEQVVDSPSEMRNPGEEQQPGLSEMPEVEHDPGTPTRSRAATIASSKCPTVFSKKSSRRSTAQTTDTTDAMEEDEVMCQGIV